MKFRFISENREKFSVQKMCRRFGVSTSGYYKYLKGVGINKQSEYEKISKLMIKLEEENDWELGGEGLRKALKKQGLEMGLSKVYRIKRMYGIYPKTVKKKKHNRRKYKENIIAKNILEREFGVGEINKAWASDIKYIETEEGWDYLAAVMDIGSRRIVGFAQQERMTVGLTIQALERAIRVRKPKAGLICHSDRGSQYTCTKYQNLINDKGFVSSMSNPGTPYDNACIESFFGTLEKNFLAFKRFKTREEARYEIWTYIEGRYNSKRMHSSLGWISPAEYEESLKIA